MNIHRTHQKFDKHLKENESHTRVCVCVHTHTHTCGFWVVLTWLICHVERCIISHTRSDGLICHVWSYITTQTRMCVWSCGYWVVLTWLICYVMCWDVSYSDMCWDVSYHSHDPMDSYVMCDMTPMSCVTWLSCHTHEQMYDVTHTHTIRRGSLRCIMSHTHTRWDVWCHTHTHTRWDAGHWDVCPSLRCIMSHTRSDVWCHTHTHDPTRVIEMYVPSRDVLSLIDMCVPLPLPQWKSPWDVCPSIPRKTHTQTHTHSHTHTLTHTHTHTHTTHTHLLPSKDTFQ